MKIIETPFSRSNEASQLAAPGVRLGRSVLLLDDSYGAMSRSRMGDSREIPLVGVSRKNLHLVIQKGNLFRKEHPDVRVVLDKGRYLVIEASAEAARRLAPSTEPCYSIRPLREDMVVFEEVEPRGLRARRESWIQSLVDSAAASSYRSSLTHLVSYPTRLSSSSHFAAAAGWAREQLNALGYTTRTQQVSLAGGATSTNVIAERAGHGPTPRGLVMVIAHLDSINAAGGPQSPAPGADDNASGAAALLELARSLRSHAAVRDLRLVLFCGEEQGLAGSRHFVSNLSADDRRRLVRIVNMDMIGTRNTVQPTVLLEAGEQAQVDALSQAAATYTNLAVQTSLLPWGSDHVPFIDAGLPAILTIEGADTSNSNIHTENDTLDHIDENLALEILRMNIAAVATDVGRAAVTPPVPGDLCAPTQEQLEKLKELCEQIIHCMDGSPAPVSPAPVVPPPVAPPPAPQPIVIHDVSGRYIYNGGAGARWSSRAPGGGAALQARFAADPTSSADEPVYIEELDARVDPIRFTLRIDVDGTDPLDVVSATVEDAGTLTPPAHFIGRVTSNVLSGASRRLVVEDFSFTWPSAGGGTVDRAVIQLRVDAAPVTASVTFHEVAGGPAHGPYAVDHDAPRFHDVEVEVDREDGAAATEPYDTHTHPDRPGDLPRESLTLERVFEDVGIRLTRSAASNVIDTSAAGPNRRWNYQELHDAMEDHWSAFANVAQWRMWIFLAELADSDGLGGVMFDGDIDEPGGVDRQGTALFTLSPWFHSAQGGYPQANPPAQQAAERELFFNLIHETGHAFNLAHSFQKTLGAPWGAPSWMPIQTDDDAMSWMNYPDLPTPGPSAKWFYDRFRFRFDDGERLFLRHAPGSFVQMGNTEWFLNHGRVSRQSLDRRLELIVRARKRVFEYGEPVILELRLRNVSDEPLVSHGSLDPDDGFVEIAVTNPRGERTPWIPTVHTRRRVDGVGLSSASPKRYEAVNLTMGKLGFAFKEPGSYRVEASYRNLDGGTAAAAMTLRVAPPASHDEGDALRELFNARVGRVLQVGGTRTIEDVTEKLEHVCKRLGKKHPALHSLRAALAVPYATSFKRLAGDSGKLELLDEDPGRVERTLAPLVQAPEDAADSLGHIQFRRVVDVYSQCARTTRKKVKAREAQESMLALFKKRKVIQPVIDAVARQVAELK